MSPGSTDSLARVSADASHADFLAGGGEMGSLMRGHDWSTSPLGEPPQWPQSLRTAVSLMLNSRYPMFIAWGPQLAFLYNDGYRPIFGAKHPHTLGLPFAEVWAEIWDDVRPLVDKALAGEATFNENLHLVMERNGFPEDTWYTFSYSPVRDETGGIGGMFCACQETTAQLLAEQNLASQALRQQRLFEQAPGFIAVLSGPDHVFEFVNEAYVRLLGRRDFLGRSAREVVPEAEGQGFYELLDRVYSSGERFVAHDVPITLQRNPDQPPEERFIDFIYAAVLDDAEQVTGIFVEGHDVTEKHHALEVREQHERRLRLMVDELNHRVRNTLAIVQGLAQQTFKGDEATPRARESFEARLGTLAASHDLLSRESWEATNLEDVIVAALTALAVDHRRYEVRGPSVRLEPKTAVTVAMAVNELATNALKYGALSNEAGTVSVIWRIEQDDERRLSLCWREQGGPAVAPPSRRGFGSRMIERALAVELRGKVELSFLSTGVMCELEARLPELPAHQFELG